MLKSTSLFVWIIGLAGCMPEPYQATAPPREGRIQLIVRVDDVGLLHTTNEVARQLLDFSIATDFSLVVNTGWFGEAVNLFRGRPGRSTGVQLTLSAPWRFFKWAPLTRALPERTFTDGFGFFHPQLPVLGNHRLFRDKTSRDSLFVLQEFRAQLRRAVSAGLEIAYLHYPSHQALFPPWMRDILEQLAYEFQIGITGYFGAVPVSLPRPPEVRTAQDMEKALIRLLNRLTPGRWVLAVPAGERTSEFYAAGLPDTTEIRYRSNLVRALRSNAVLALSVERGIELVSYRQLLEQAGLWRRPFTSKTNHP